MMQKKPSVIGIAPSVADIKSARTRVGKVDFGTSLSARFSEEEPDGTLDEIDAPPPAAPAEAPEPEPADDPSHEAHLAVDALDGETRAAARSTGEMLERLMSLMAKDTQDTQDTLDTQHTPPEAFAVPDPTSPSFSTGPTPARPGRPDEAVGRTVAEVAESLIAAMRRVNEAHERHVVALELETARRCELLTSQADLDAELIRLHARRDAHAIVFAARSRTGEVDIDLHESEQLEEIGETFSRFAETIETTVASRRPFPDFPQDS
ncbi:hypothetical protein [Nocardioides sp.]|uniref:hypothetical protein n=1 Tax=Nocardioides sp. TaxID=35761 RepID=UPI00271C913B|nr:hypothetical protein [Nocardioides sp.]MDO9456314.1 hypothetical protein [Nocardioides sp.]